MNSFETRSPNGDVQRITALTWAPVNTHVPHCRLQLVQNPEVVRGLEKMHPWHPHCRSTLILRPWPLTFVSSPTVWIIFKKKTKKKNLEINAFNKEGYTSEVFPQLAIRTMSNMSGSIKGCFFFPEQEKLQAKLSPYLVAISVSVCEILGFISCWNGTWHLLTQPSCRCLSWIKSGDKISGYKELFFLS